ncbi:MAG: TIGR03546 family protein [Planctomycetota bacterium]
MLSAVIRPLRGAVAMLAANDSPRQIAAGVALGAVIGLTPKGNLIAATLLALLLATRVNRSAGLGAAALFSWVGLHADGLTHRIGAYLLTLKDMQPHYAAAYELPLGPWIGFNNTVVLGSLVLGLYIAYPVYLLARMPLDRYQAPVAAWLRRRRVGRWLLGADVTSRVGLPTQVRLPTPWGAGS